MQLKINLKKKDNSFSFATGGGVGLD